MGALPNYAENASQEQLQGHSCSVCIEDRADLDRLDAAKEPEDMDLPGYKFHPLKGDRMGAYAVFVNANWRITFEFDGQDAVNVNLEDYH